MIELSVPELFSTDRRKVGEVLIRAERPATDKRDFQNYVLARVPGHFVFYTRGAADAPTYVFPACDLQGHVALFGSENGGNGVRVD